jgi:hypothetical protein
MKNKLEIELYRIDNLVLGRVTHMDEELRGTGSLAKKGGQGDFGIVSSATSELRARQLFVRGDGKRSDNQRFSYAYGTPEQADKVCKIIRELVNEINNDGNEKKEEIKDWALVEY